MVNKKLRKLIYTSILCLSLSPFRAFAGGETNQLERYITQSKSSVSKITTANLNMRAGAGTNYGIITTIPSGKTVTVLSSSGNWYKVQYSGKTGYVSAEYLKDAESVTTYKVTATSLNIRSESSTTSNIIGKLSKDTIVDVVTIINNTWAKIKYNNQYAYCSMSYLTKVTSSQGDTSISSKDNPHEVTIDVNLRKSNNWSAESIMVIKQGEEVDVLSKDNSWSYVNYRQNKGYISNTYLKSTSNNQENITTTAYETTTALNVRNSESWSATILGLINKGTVVNVISINNGWAKINYNGNYGYISSEYLKAVTNNETSLKSITMDVYLRKDKNWSSEKITLISKGQKVNVISQDKEWTYVEYNNQKGYVTTQYIEGYSSDNDIEVDNESTSTITKITTTNLNMRTNAGTSYDIITTIPAGTEVTVLETKGSWDKIKYNDKIGFVNNNYLTTSELAPSTEYSKITVALDAGHGGTDPGAIGLVKKLKEKDLVLEITNKVNSILKSLGFKTVLTRSTDTYVTLSNRYTIANNANADLFVSTHFNSASSTSAKGIETLYRGSTTLAKSLQDALIKSTSATNRGLKQRTDLAVLNGTKMPAALVELGFISNTDEEALISTGEYKNKLINGIVNGIVNYTKTNLINK